MQQSQQGLQMPSFPQSAAIPQQGLQMPSFPQASYMSNPPQDNSIPIFSQSSGMQQAPQGFPQVSGMQQVPQGFPQASGIQQAPQGFPQTSGIQQVPQGLPQVSRMQQAPQCFSQASGMQQLSKESQSVEATPQMSKEQKEQKWIGMLNDAIQKKGKLSEETVTKIIADTQKKSFSDSKYLRVLDLIFQLSSKDVIIQYGFLKQTVIEASTRITRGQDQLEVHDYINIAKMFFLSRLNHITNKDFLQTLLNLWSTNFPPILSKEPALTASDSIMLLCFTTKYGQALADPSIAYLSKIICEHFKDLDLQDLRNLFWLYNQNTAIYEPLKELMYAALEKDSFGIASQTDEKSIKDIFFILIAGARLKYTKEAQVDRSTLLEEGTIMTRDSKSQQERFLQWLEKNKISLLKTTGKNFLSLINAPADAPAPKPQKKSKGKKKGNVDTQIASSKIECKKKAEKIARQEDRQEEVASWLRKSLAFFRDAIILYLTDKEIAYDTAIETIDEGCAQYLYDAFYNAATVAIHLHDIKLSVFCLYAILELRQGVEKGEAKSALSALQNTRSQHPKKLDTEVLKRQKEIARNVAILKAQQKVKAEIDWLVGKLHHQFYELVDEEEDNDDMLADNVAIINLDPDNLDS